MKVDWFQHCPDYRLRDQVEQLVSITLNPFLKTSSIAGTIPSEAVTRFRHFIGEAEQNGQASELIICIISHADNTGRFTDQVLGNQVWWTPEWFWHGNSEWNFCGYQKLIHDSGYINITILFAQCHGARFADHVREIVRQNPIHGKTIEVSGLSYGSTNRPVIDSRQLPNKRRPDFHVETMEYINIRAQGRMWFPFLNGVRGSGITNISSPLINTQQATTTNDEDKCCFGITRCFTQ
jgi:hypothetical protein